MVFLVLVRVDHVGAVDTERRVTLCDSETFVETESFTIGIVGSTLL